ncbi:sigma-70 family RNA polymerase sigma factor [Cellulomonas humilata]|uniref:Sigma-70 family RNA polymerase sigma factor n=1 Tax=Cellulomonas humilata TaxID=144055 RepID=A0A7Y6A5P6_9CELL|nr:sigma-70 family RNA polymerase sigma factor [Cellulomonas humilata]NUU19548.1 sigma-70 family RNA polymerase sigma factor [Cellulomonas humilata]
MSSDPPLEDLLRELAPQVLGVLVRRSGDLADAQDALQDALLAATTQWPAQGVPDNPRAWLVVVGQNKLVDRYRSEEARRRREELVGTMEAVDAGDAFETDDSLLLLFGCCHPALSPASAVALTLRSVGGLTTAEIARAFLVPEATMAQRLSRARRTLRDLDGPFRMPSAQDYPARLRAVLRVLYLMFNEGYASTTGTSVARADLSAEALRLTRTLHESLPDDPEVAGLLALVLLTDARRPARTGPRGELVSLTDQDRGLWDRAMVDEGVALVEDALVRGSVGEYQLQAAIAAVHDEAPSTDATDWPQLLALYGLLERMTGNPMVTLNRAVALAMVRGPDAGLALLATLDDRLPGHHRLAAVRGHLMDRAGRPGEAADQLLLAARGTTSLAERDYLLVQVARLRHGSAS